MAKKNANGHVLPRVEVDGEALPPCLTTEGDQALALPVPWVRPEASTTQGYLAASDPDFRKDFPTLHAFLTLQGYGGKQRKAGSLSLFCQDGKFKACVSDNDAGNRAFVSGDTFQSLLGAIERGLSGGGLDWREMQPKRK